LGVEASLRVLEELNAGGTSQRATLSRKLEQLVHEARKALEQYDAVDARNRLAASELERRWDGKLEEIEAVKQRLSSLETERYSLSRGNQNTFDGRSLCWSENNVKISNRQQLGFARRKRCRRGRPLAFRTAPISAGIKRNAGMRTVLTPIDMAAKRGCATNLDRRHHASLGEA
jgi:hypothetical protein